MPRREPTITLDELLADYPTNLHDTIRRYVTNPDPVRHELERCTICDGWYVPQQHRFHAETHFCSEGCKSVWRERNPRSDR